mgnify:CR=1 FL=1
MPDTTCAFYQFDTVPYALETGLPDAGVAVDSGFSRYFVPDYGVLPEAGERPSLFVGHTLDVQHQALVERTVQGAPMWVFALLLILTALTMFYYRQHKLRLKDLLASLVDSRAMDRMLRNNSLTRVAQLVPMALLMLACLALPVYDVALSGTGVPGYLLLTAALAALYLLRNGLMSLLGRVFDDQAAVAGYITNNYLYHLVLATVLLPLLFLMTYMPHGGGVMQWIVLMVVILEFLLRVVRGLKVFFTQTSCSHFYLFYYLCIVETAPILVLIKWLIE